jgi:hypothetical protein
VLTQISCLFTSFQHRHVQDVHNWIS